MSIKAALVISFLAFVLGFTIEATSAPKGRQAIESAISDSITELVADIRLTEDIEDINAGRLTRGLLDLPKLKKNSKTRPAKIRQIVD